MLILQHFRSFAFFFLFISNVRRFVGLSVSHSREKMLRFSFSVCFVLLILIVVSGCGRHTNCDTLLCVNCVN